MTRSRVFSFALVLAASVVAIAAARPYISSWQEEMPQPTEEHAMLMKAVGEWEGTITMFGMGPEPMVSKAKESIESIGGFWTQSRFSCDFMGMPFVGSSTMGYDAAKKKYVATWIDSMTSYLTVMEGDCDMKTKTQTMHYMAPNMEGKIVPHRTVTVYGDDNYTSNFFVGEGEGEKSMTIAMKRKVVGEKKTGK